MVCIQIWKFFVMITSFISLHSIEFDRDFDYFAIAGVTKKIKVLPSPN